MLNICLWLIRKIISSLLEINFHINECKLLNLVLAVFRENSSHFQLPYVVGLKNWAFGGSLDESRWIIGIVFHPMWINSTNNLQVVEVSQWKEVVNFQHLWIGENGCMWLRKINSEEGSIELYVIVFYTRVLCYEYSRLDITTK